MKAVSADGGNNINFSPERWYSTTDALATGKPSHVPKPLVLYTPLPRCCQPNARYKKAQSFTEQRCIQREPTEYRISMDTILRTLCIRLAIRVTNLNTWGGCVKHVCFPLRKIPLVGTMREIYPGIIDMI